MVKHNFLDTIVAISTPIGESGIGIVRLSGKNSLKITDKIFVAKDGKKASSFKTYTVHYGWVVNSPQTIVHRTQKKKPWTEDRGPWTDVVDEVILTIMRAPRSYTKEDVVEINCHGGIVALRKVLDLVLENGARLAEPGEFTKRAFLNGRIDLAQAEAVIDVIRAKTEAALKIGTAQLKGGLSSELNKFRKALLEVLTVLEANLDFPEEETNAVNFKQMREKLNQTHAALKNLVESARQGKIIREGIHLVICGKPNVGKSSLLNALLKQERSIVTPIPGTTRDSIEEIIDIKGIPIRIVDTAGILEPRDLVEKKAVERAKQQIDLADLVLLLFDASTRLSKEDQLLMEKLRKKTVLAIINKIDLKQKVEKEKIYQKFNLVVEISAKKAKNINLLEEAIVDLVYQGKVSAEESILLSNLRHSQALRKAEKLVAGALNSLDNKLTLELICQEIKEALALLDEVLGKRFSEDLLEKIFSEFCIGK
jgi:tRNA modification GTPase